MIHNSFIFLERVSAATERNIWRQGVPDWSSFLDAKSIRGISPVRKRFFDKALIEARCNLQQGNSSYFANRLPVSEAWRLYDHFSDECLFLDIETSGYYGDITVIGMYDGNDVMTMVKGRGLDKHNLRELLSRYKLLVTFNGLSFDVPVINRCFNRIIPDIPHLDLRFPLAKLGFSGGLKKIESMRGIRRSERTTGLSGEDALHLWSEYSVCGDDDALNLLVEYNTEDVINLKPLARFVYDSMKKRMMDDNLKQGV